MRIMSVNVSCHASIVAVPRDARMRQITFNGVVLRRTVLCWISFVFIMYYGDVLCIMMLCCCIMELYCVVLCRAELVRYIYIYIYIYMHNMYVCMYVCMYI